MIVNSEITNHFLNLNLRGLYDGELEGLTYDRICSKTYLQTNSLLILLLAIFIIVRNKLRTIGFLGYKKIILIYKRLEQQIEKNYITKKWPKVLFIEPSNVIPSSIVLHHREYF